MFRMLRFPLAAALGVGLSGCSTLGYYGQLARGQYQMLSAREPIAKLIADPRSDPQLRRRLETAAAARAFASGQLALPRNASYTQYADLHRPYATWNVFAAAEFSVEPRQHCYPLVGCLAYRGYFDRERADAEAARLAGQGLDTWVGGSTAYSSLGWFADPVLNTMLRWDDDELAGTIFHELAHQRAFARGDTEFNESYATFVQREGLREWHAARGLAPAGDARDAQRREFEVLVLATRERLRALYALPLGDPEKRARKAAEIERLRRDYRERRAAWGADPGWDGWIEAPINNAKLLPFGLYDRWVPAFAALFARAAGDWSVFHADCARLAGLAPAARRRELEALGAADR